MNQLPRKENKHRLKLMEKLENRKRPRSLSQLPGLKKSLKIQVGLMKMMLPMMQPTLIKLVMRKEPKKNPRNLSQKRFSHLEVSSTTNLLKIPVILTRMLQALMMKPSLEKLPMLEEPKNKQRNQDLEVSSRT